MQQARRKRLYFTMMGVCLLLVVLAWNVVRLFSVTAAVVMSVVAAVIPPAASIVGNLGAVDASADRTGRQRPPPPDPDR